MICIPRHGAVSDRQAYSGGGSLHSAQSIMSGSIKLNSAGLPWKHQGSRAVVP